MYMHVYNDYKYVMNISDSTTTWTGSNTAAYTGQSMPPDNRFCKFPLIDCCLVVKLSAMITVGINRFQVQFLLLLSTWK